MNNILLFRLFLSGSNKNTEEITTPIELYLSTPIGNNLPLSSTNQLDDGGSVNTQDSDIIYDNGTLPELQVTASINSFPLLHRAIQYQKGQLFDALTSGQLSYEKYNQYNTELTLIELNSFNNNIREATKAAVPYLLPIVAAPAMPAIATLSKPVAAVLSNPYVLGAFAADAIYRQGFTDEGWRKTAKAIKEKRYDDAAFKAGDVIPLSMRDDFNRNNIRFGFAPWLVPATTAVGLGLSNQQALGGNLFYDGGESLPEVLVTANYPTEDLIKANIESQWASAKNLPFYNITKDPTFTKERTGAGSIEYFNEPSITYDNGITIKNPNNNPTLLFDPNTNTVDDIKLDLLHHYREYDPVYQEKLNAYQSALMSDKSTADNVLWNSLLGLIFMDLYAKRDNNGNITNWEDWDTLVLENRNNPEYIIQGVDGSLRNLLANEHTLQNSNYLPLLEAIQQWLSLENAKKAFDDLNNYLVTGEKALGGPLFNSRTPIESFQGGKQLPTVRY